MIRWNRGLDPRWCVQGAAGGGVPASARTRGGVGDECGDPRARRVGGYGGAAARLTRGRLRAVFHCFGKVIEQARELIGRGASCVLHGHRHIQEFAAVKDTAAVLAADAFMVETDCPFLSPAPHRGKRCEPAHTRLVAEKIAALRNATAGDDRVADDGSGGSIFPFSAVGRRERSEVRPGPHTALRIVKRIQPVFTGSSSTSRSACRSLPAV